MCPEIEHMSSIHNHRSQHIDLNVTNIDEKIQNVLKYKPLQAANISDRPIEKSIVVLFAMLSDDKS